MRGWSDLALQRKALIVAAIPVVALLVVSATFVLAREAEARATELVSRTLAVQAELGRVQALLVDAETGVRGYLLTEDPGFLEPYERARDDLPVELASPSCSDSSRATVYC
jgi:CHASE3 domain sensor protein